MRWPHSLEPMHPEATTSTPAEDTALPLDELSPELAGLLASWKPGEQTGKKPAAKAAAAATAEEAGADDPDETQNVNDNADDDADDSTDSDKSQTPADEGKGEEEEAGAADKAKIKKRIDTLTAQQKGLQDQLTALKGGRADPGQPIALVPLPEDLLTYLTEPEEVDADLDRGRKALAWCNANRNGGTVPKAAGSSQVQELSAEEVEAIRDEQVAIREHAPRRKDWIRAYQQRHAEAEQAWPQQFKSADSKAVVAEMIKEVPGLARHPHHEMIMGDALAGAQLRSGQLTAVAVGKNPLPASAGKTAAAVASPRPALSGSRGRPLLLAPWCQAGHLRVAGKSHERRTQWRRSRGGQADRQVWLTSARSELFPGSHATSPCSGARSSRVIWVSSAGR